MKYGIIENEYYALENLKKVMQRLKSDYELVFTSESVEDCVVYFNSDTEKPDLIFMDIELVDGNCFEIFEKARIETPIIFTTAYNQFAIQAFKQYSIDYLLKPISEEALAGALNKFEKYYNKENKPIQNMEELLAEKFLNKKSKKRILVSRGDDYSYADIRDIACFISEEKYIFLISFSGSRSLTQYVNLNQVEEELDPHYFFRVSRNMIINISNISKVSKYFNGRLKVLLKPVHGVSEEAVISSARKDDFLKWLDGNL
ncbi:LytTR family DNA-binding domain-containing protein [Epilithonimonas sp.]|uniref:LytR/AlgR family response regulator transcription factor n=1 Tax=Epilithonimonas sp. TaxID=2894511 RepID=UPI0028AB86C6|nr:LytTR family DNA-binding domain-containing protein [Epilithonimonas sp.]